MKTIKRRLLSVLMVMAIVCTLIPTALAAGGSLSLGLGQNATLTAEFSEGGLVPGGGYIGIGLARFAYATWSVSGNATLSNQNTTSNNSSVTVTAGMVPGTATVTATAYYYYVYNGSTGGSSWNPGNNVVALDSRQWTITIGGGVSGSYATISQSSMTLAQGASDTVAITPVTGYTLQNVTWGSTNPTIATVNGSGNYGATVNAVAQGNTSIYANFEVLYSGYPMGTGSVSCAVTVTGVIGLSPSSIQLPVGDSKNLIASVANGLGPVTWSVENTANAITYTTNGNSITITGAAVGRATVTAMVQGTDGKPYSASCTVDVGKGTLALSSSTMNLSLYGNNFLSVRSINGDPISNDISIVWKSSDSNVVSFSNTSNSGIASGVSSVSLYARAPGQATITATAYRNNVEIATGSCVVTVASIQAKATVYSTENGFTLGSTNLKTPTSVVSQIASALSGYTGYGALQYVTFSNVTSTYGSLNASVNTPYYYSTYGGTGYFGNLSAITFTPSTTAVGSAVFNFTAYVSNGVTTTNPTAYPGTLTITVEKGSAGIDVLYSTTVGQSVKVNVQDFQSFWTKNVSSLGSLRYVVFGAATGSVGQLYYTSGTQNYAVGSQQFYYSPAAGQNALSGVYFAPTAYGTTRTGTLAVPFTAYGTSNYNTTSMTSASGTLYVCVTNGAVQDVTYQANTNGVTLNPADFQAVYRQATGTAAASPTVYIQFLNVPTYGALYYNYKSGIFGGTGTKLTSANVGTMVFSNTTATVYGINDLTYIPGSGNLTDTVRYVAYSTNGGTPLYVGEIVFGAVSVAPIKYYATGSGTAAFKASDFFNADTGLITAQYISFGKPSSGTLYQNYSNGRGTAVTTADRFSYYGTGTNASINNVTYVPVSGYTGVVTIPYTGYTATGGQISGNVKVYVVAKPFTDVPSTHWSYEYVMELVASGIVGGVTPTTFYPNSELKYGEALKLIMLAAGYSEQAKTGSHWASGYLTRAYRDGLVSSANIDLNAVIDRYTMATIAAKALKLSPVSNITSPFVDTKDPYVLALYKAGIVEGTTANGLTYYKGDSAFVRSEVCAIICRMNDYTLSK